MELLNLFRKLFRYDYWANRETLAPLDPAIPGLERAFKVFCHIVGAQRVWLARLNQGDVSFAQPWPELSLDECRAAVEDLQGTWNRYLGGLTTGQLDESVIYQNTKGAEFRTPLADLLQHVVTHSAYHRGQVAAAIRQAGLQPAPTDYVVFVRQVEKSGQF